MNRYSDLDLSQLAVKNCLFGLLQVDLGFLRLRFIIASKYPLHAWPLSLARFAQGLSSGLDTFAELMHNLHFLFAQSANNSHIDCSSYYSSYTSFTYSHEAKLS